MPKTSLTNTDSLQNHVGAVLSVLWLASEKNWDSYVKLVDSEVRNVAETNLNHMNTVIKMTKDLPDAR